MREIPKLATAIITLACYVFFVQHVGEKSLKAFHKLQPIMRPANSHAHYRKVLSGVHRRDPCIPYFGMLCNATPVGFRFCDSDMTVINIVQGFTYET